MPVTRSDPYQLGHRFHAGCSGRSQNIAVFCLLGRWNEAAESTSEESTIQYTHPLFSPTPIWTRPAKRRQPTRSLRNFFLLVPTIGQSFGKQKRCHLRKVHR